MDQRYANPSLIVTTTNSVEGHFVKSYLGLCRGVVVRSPTVTQGLSASVKSVFGGSIGAYQDMCELARKQSFENMVENAFRLGANAVLGIRFDTSGIAGNDLKRGAAEEVLCYGTAVIVEHCSGANTGSSNLGTRENDGNDGLGRILRRIPEL